MESKDVIYRRVAGMDVPKTDVKVCVRVPSSQRNRYHSQVTTWGATVPEIMELKAFLEGLHLELVGKESTSDYWKLLPARGRGPGAAGQRPAGAEPAGPENGRVPIRLGWRRPPRGGCWPPPLSRPRRSVCCGT